jgi:hypothetical protein
MLNPQRPTWARNLSQWSGKFGKFGDTHSFFPSIQVDVVPQHATEREEWVSPISPDFLPISAEDFCRAGFPTFPISRGWHPQKIERRYTSMVYIKES